MAQSALETQRGSKCINWNLAGIKHTTEALYTFSSTLEILPRRAGETALAKSTPSAPCELAEDQGGETITVRFGPNHPAACFAAYGSLEEGVHGFLSLLGGRYASALAAARDGDVAAYVRALKIHGYFTADEGDYLRNVAALVDEYRAPCLATRWELASAFARLGLWPADDFSLVVRRFQSTHRCRVDGIVGPETRRAIRAALAALP
ncbi:hypothetical protein LZC95_08120 [Pendulispora brunnea]|uniref:Peptidoglycan binding-like domain-containing protein n=1 Tax=Pendulispora brunnea TaxID=2905690 RepID=A0ABZ2KKA6_9BACT